MNCRSCGSSKLSLFLDLQASPTSNAFLAPDALNKPEVYFPLSVYICQDCKLAQIGDQRSGDTHFHSEYVYFSSTTAAFVEHARRYVEGITERLALDAGSFVVEAASNDGYLLQFFKKSGIPCLGVEPSASTAKEALEKRDVESLIDFFGVQTATRITGSKGHADLFIGNNVLAHVVDINDFIGGISTLLKDTGTATLEFPHLLTMLEETQFDTVYHEHYSYISLIALQSAAARQNMYVYDVEEIPVHGGSLRVYLTKTGSGIEVTDRVSAILKKETDAGLDRADVFAEFQARTDKITMDFMSFLVSEKLKGKKIAGYGAAAKGNTFLNYCGVKPNLIEYVIDLTPAKQGMYLPGSRIPVYSEDKLREEQPDYIVILPWNWRDAIEERLAFTREWGAKLVVAIPSLEIF